MKVLKWKCESVKAKVWYGAKERFARRWSRVCKHLKLGAPSIWQPVRFHGLEMSGAQQDSLNHLFIKSLKPDDLLVCEAWWLLLGKCLDVETPDDNNVGILIFWHCSNVANNRELWLSDIYTVYVETTLTAVSPWLYLVSLVAHISTPQLHPGIKLNKLNN